MRLLGQRAGPAYIAFLQGSARTVHVVADLSYGFLLLRVEHTVCEAFQLVVCRTQQLLRILTLARGFFGGHSGDNLRGRFTRSPLAHNNLSRTAFRRGQWRPAVLFTFTSSHSRIRLLLLLVRVSAFLSGEAEASAGAWAEDGFSAGAGAVGVCPNKGKLRLSAIASPHASRIIATKELLNTVSPGMQGQGSIGNKKPGKRFRLPGSWLG